MAFAIAALGKSARGWTRTDGSVTAPHNAGDAALGGPRGENHPFAARERAVAHGARHFKNVDRDLCWNVDIRFRFIEDRRADYPVTVLCDVLAVSPAGYYAWRSRSKSWRSASNPYPRKTSSGSIAKPRDPMVTRIHRRTEGSAPGVSRGRIERLMGEHGIRHHGKATTGAHDRQPSRISDRAQPA